MSASGRKRTFADVRYRPEADIVRIDLHAVARTGLASVEGITFRVPSVCRALMASKKRSTKRFVAKGSASENEKDPPKRVLFALISDCALPALLPALFSRHRVCEEILVLRCEALRKLQNLKAVAIADGPELDIG